MQSSMLFHIVPAKISSLQGHNECLKPCPSSQFTLIRKVATSAIVTSSDVLTNTGHKPHNSNSMLKKSPVVKRQQGKFLGEIHWGIDTYKDAISGIADCKLLETGEYWQLAPFLSLQVSSINSLSGREYQLDIPWSDQSYGSALSTSLVMASTSYSI